MNKTDRFVFDTAFELWSARTPQTAVRRRLKRFTYGDQWGDRVTDCSGEVMTEAEQIGRKGGRVMTNNLIRRLVKTIVGRYRDMSEKNGWYDRDETSADVRLELAELDSRLLEEFLISGMAIQRIADDDPLNGQTPGVVNVNPEGFIVNDFRDPRGHDIEIVGMLHDMSPAEALMRFGDGTPATRQRIEKIISAADTGVAVATGDMPFFVPMRGRARVVEVWTREYSGTGSVTWRVRWYGASGQLLKSYVSPWKHGRHPFEVKFYPLTDGEVHSFVEDIVDQQKYINRLIVLIDKILATSAKGVLLYPLNQLPKNCDWEDVSRRWASTDGILPITGQGEILPQAINGMGGDSNAYRLLEMELRLFDQTSGVGSALLGTDETGSRITGADHYQARIENATIALADIMQTFRSMLRRRDDKLYNLR